MCFAQIYHAPNWIDCYEHRILNFMSQSLKLYEKSLMTKNITLLRHQCTIYVVQVVADLAKILHIEIQIIYHAHIVLVL